ncbi:unnamed protein product [Clavelina lepadiformis]|uniref:Carboxylic ester hydrolase n=2 Tax=Clavelina lepadiformis TaxID=159417 RepID=A0ABP0H0N8_CLALP
MSKKIIGSAIAILIAGGVIATVLCVLMIPSISNNDESTTNAMEGEYVYVDVPGQGKVKGRKSEQGTAIFASIPFSLPPTDDYRWQRPRPMETLEGDESGYYDATYARAACPQNCELPSPAYVCPQEISEDCLHLVVNVPARLTKEVKTNEGHYYTLIDKVKEEKLPVMVFFFGGAFIAGGNGPPLYDARFLGEKNDVITVVPNYRVGPFGLFYQDTGDEDAILGNFAIWDQIEALKWTNKYIETFGGDPSMVTIFGQSAGGQSVAVHLVNKYSEPLFHRAILQSNPFGITYKTTEEAQETTNKFVKHCSDCKVNDVACLRKLTMSHVLTCLYTFPLIDQYNKNSFSQLFEPWAPVIEHDLLEEHPYYAFLEGRNQNKPIIHGTTKDEGMFFIMQALADPSQSNQLYEIITKALFGSDKAESVTKMYPPDCPRKPLPAKDCDNRYAMNDLVTDYMFTCPSRRVFNTNTRLGDANLNVWWYTFNQTWSFPYFWEQYTLCYNLTCHSADLPYVFDMDTLTQFRFTKEESILAEKIGRYWTNFAKYGNPNDPNEPTGNGYHHPKMVQTLDGSQEFFGDENTFAATTLGYWPKLYEGSTKNSIQSQTMHLTASGEYFLTDFRKQYCDFFDDLDLYLNDSIKLRESSFKRAFSIV